MKSNEGFIDVTGGKVYWRSVNNGSKIPILTLHGGPGFSHDLLVEPFEKLNDGRNIFFYDQLGSGKSDRPNDLGLWMQGTRNRL
jgi:proline iminopeptidase